MKRMRILLRNITVVLLLSAFCGGAAAQSAFIYHIGVGQGDATLLIITNKLKEKISILIDAGNSSKKGDAVFGVLKQYLGDVKTVNFIITSHLHSDHIGGMKQVLTQLTANKWKIGYIIDRAAQHVVDNDPACYDASGNPEYLSNDDAPLIPSSQVVNAYSEYTNNFVSKIARLNINTGLDLLNTWAYTNGFAPGLHFTSLTSGGLVCNNGMDLTSKLDLSGNAHNENDYSYSFLLEIGQFRYFTGGDIGGARPYVDLETPLVQYFNTRTDAAGFHFCTYKATHHGSPHSTNPAFVARTTPTVTVVPSALRSFSGTQLPGQQTLTRIENSSTNRTIFYTYTWTGGSTAYSGKVNDYKDVVFTIDSAAFALNRQITIQTALRDKTSLALKGTWSSSTFTCTKHGALLGAVSLAETADATVEAAFTRPAAGAVKPVVVKKYSRYFYKKKRKKLRRHKLRYHGKYA